MDNEMLDQKSQNSQKLPLTEILRENPSYLFSNILHPTNRVQCQRCKRDVTKQEKIICETGQYCVGCFSRMEPFPEYYHVINKLDFPLYEGDWTADEDLLMFEGLEKHGFGNWSEIADFIGTNKTREDVQQHYNNVYVSAPRFLPENREPLSKRDPTTHQLNQYPCPPKHMKVNNREQTLNYKNQRGHLTLNTQTSSNLKTGTNPAEIIGYIPKRGDFQVQYDNEAELLLAEMEFNDDDTEEERQMKYRLIEIYNHKLTERIRRKQFVISRKLLDIKEVNRLEKTRSKEEKQIYNMMRVFARFHSAEDHEKLVQGIIKQKQIRQRIQELKEMKKRGFRTLAQIQQQLENKRKKQEKLKKKGQESFFGYDANKTRRSISKATNIERVSKRVNELSREEEQICEKFEITHQNYQKIKDHIIRESVRQGILERDAMTRVFRINRSAVDSIFDFLVEKQDIIMK